MDGKDIELKNPEDLLTAAQNLIKDIQDSKADFSQLGGTLKEIQAQLEFQNKLQDDYRDFFAALLQGIKGEQEFDRDLDVESACLYKFSQELAAKAQKIEEGNASLQQERDQLEKDKEQFQQEKTDRESILAKIKEECRMQAREEIEKELAPLRTDLTAKQNELQTLHQQIADAEKELQTKKQQIEQFGPAAVSAPADRPMDMQKVLAEFEAQGYAAPSDINPCGLYLCTPEAYVEIKSANVMRSVLQRLDEEEFQRMGKPQIVLRRLENGSCAAFPTALKNSINGQLLEEETPVPQGAIIKMTDKAGEEHTVKVLIGM